MIIMKEVNIFNNILESIKKERDIASVKLGS